jgi:uncharacterized membrane protein
LKVTSTSSSCALLNDCKVAGSAMLRLVERHPAAYQNLSRHSIVNGGDVTLLHGGWIAISSMLGSTNSGSTVLLATGVIAETSASPRIHHVLVQIRDGT